MTNDTTVLPDGSAFATGSMPLPKDHWIYKETGEPPTLLRCGTDDPKRKELKKAIQEGVQYAIKGASANGSLEDMDPDAIVQNAVVGIIGYNTPDGTDLSSDLYFETEKETDDG